MEFYNEDDTFLVSVPFSAEIELVEYYKICITRETTEWPRFTADKFKLCFVVIPVRAV